MNTPARVITGAATTRAFIADTVATLAPATTVAVTGTEVIGAEGAIMITATTTMEDQVDTVVQADTGARADTGDQVDTAGTVEVRTNKSW